ncbi:tryptophan synthase subunit alpha [Caldivirga maquilingensis]|uniref:tryptophan synthase n=1 Tax=Caldivirga maquilingensis (strain ATCC 700844 / DSM 13496 / JCM 10307 / IC-167) TaxID=397948 RepID=A8MDM0_CALMQ|nr:tryptophan synthase subunit alpha [Caldivirga maquilingensis]ABW01876.1 tryptophan synthase, alpha subunit [Caldivirga maquilingensis IC-167]
MGISRPALGLYLTATYPSTKRFLETLDKISGLVDFLEIGIPTRNPKYDGPVIRMAHQGAELMGLNAVKVTDDYSKYGKVPVLMGYISDYVNSLNDVAKTASDVGAATVLFPDLIFDYPELIGRYIEVMRSNGLAPSFFISSKTPYRLIRSLSEQEPLFIYLGLYAATGIKLPIYIEQNVVTIRGVLGDAFLIVGFAVNSPDMVRSLIKAGADGVVVGSAFIQRMSDLNDALSFLKWLRGGLP